MQVGWIITRTLALLMSLWWLDEGALSFDAEVPTEKQASRDSLGSGTITREVLLAQRHGAHSHSLSVFANKKHTEGNDHIFVFRISYLDLHLSLFYLSLFSPMSAERADSIVKQQRKEQKLNTTDPIGKKKTCTHTHSNPLSLCPPLSLSLFLFWTISPLVIVPMTSFSYCDKNIKTDQRWCSHARSTGPESDSTCFQLRCCSDDPEQAVPDSPLVSHSHVFWNSVGREAPTINNPVIATCCLF